jgi:hypothetical protein
MEKSAFLKNGFILQSPVKNPEYAILSIIWILIDRLQKKTGFMNLYL